MTVPTLRSAMSAAVYKALRSCCVKEEGTVMTQSLITLPPKLNVISLACCSGSGGRGEGVVGGSGGRQQKGVRRKQDG